MARTTAGPRAGRGLLGLLALLAVLGGTAAGGVVWSDAQWTPQLALDLEGGTEIILEPRPQEGQTGEVTDEVLQQAVEIISQRINGTGVSEAEVTTQGGRNIVVAIPGEPDPETLDLVRQSAQLNFRPVLVEQAAVPPQPSAAPTAGATTAPTDGATVAPTDGATVAPTDGATPPADETVAPVPSETTQGRAVPNALAAGTPTPTGTATAPADGATSPPADGATSPPADGATPAPTPTDASDLAQLSPEVISEFQALDCTQRENVQGGREGDPDEVLVTCSQDGAAKYILGPVEVSGDTIDEAVAGIETNQQGVSTGQWIVQLNFDGEGTEAFSDVTTRLFGLEPPRNQFAIVLDGLVVSAPVTQSPIPGGEAQISGSFTQETATTLANQLRFGALPLSFEVQTEQRISATLGEEQLQRALLAGALGLGLVVLYSLLQYRALGAVIVASLAVGALITYLFIVLLGWRQGLRLSLPGVAGLIIGIATAADSFIVYFERIRDELREGRDVRTAVEVGWQRARRTIVASDAVSMLAAVVLYVLAVGSVRGFAFMLGLAVIVDLIAVFLFTKPLLTLLARTRFFGEGRRFSGFDTAGRRAPAYRGRGRLEPRRGGRGPAGERTGAGTGAVPDALPSGGASGAGVGSAAGTAVGTGLDTTATATRTARPRRRTPAGATAAPAGDAPSGLSGTGSRARTEGTLAERKARAAREAAERGAAEGQAPAGEPAESDETSAREGSAR